VASDTFFYVGKELFLGNNPHVRTEKNEVIFSMSKHFAFLGICAAAMFLMASSKVQAQSGTFAVDHFTSADQSYDFVNSTRSHLYVNIFVYYNEDPVACGAGSVSPNGSLSADLHTNLIAAPVTGVKPPVGVIKIVYATTGNPGFILTPATGIKTFRTKGSSEIELNDDVPLTSAESSTLVNNCGDIWTVLSGVYNITFGPTD
jgi:hypothetical protein